MIVGGVSGALYCDLKEIKAAMATFYFKIPLAIL